MNEAALLPHLFRTEYRKIVSVLCALFGIEHIEAAEDLVSDTFLAASEQWGMKGVPENPTAWLYTVAKNKTKNYLRRNAFFAQTLSPEIRYTADKEEEIQLDLSRKSINDSQLAMMFTVCDPCIAPEAQIALALNLLCGFGIQEIADAFLIGKEAVYKRLSRAKEKLKEEKIKIEQPAPKEMDARLDNVLTTLYLLFSEGYYSTSQSTVLRKDLCAESMRLCYLLVENESTNKPAVNALLSLMCFHSSRFDARTSDTGEMILYDDQDETLWNKELIEKGEYFLNRAASGTVLSKYHLEAGIAYWHTKKNNPSEKWENILQLYNTLLMLEYSPMAALNRTFALAKANGKAEAILEAEKLQLTDNHFYYLLLGDLYTGIDNKKALQHFESALKLAGLPAEKSSITKRIERIEKQIIHNKII